MRCAEAIPLSNYREIEKNRYKYRSFFEENLPEG
jgi:hypothetical protein